MITSTNKKREVELTEAFRQRLEVININLTVMYNEVMLGNERALNAIKYTKEKIKEIKKEFEKEVE